MEQWCLWPFGPCLRAEVWAAWAQAILSTFAIGVAIWVAAHQAKTAREMAERQHDDAVRRAEQLKASEAEEALTRCMTIIFCIHRLVVGSRDRFIADPEKWYGYWYRVAEPGLRDHLDNLNPEILNKLTDSYYFVRVVEAKYDVFHLLNYVENLRCEDGSENVPRSLTEQLKVYEKHFWDDLMGMQKHSGIDLTACIGAQPFK